MRPSLSVQGYSSRRRLPCPDGFIEKSRLSKMSSKVTKTAVSVIVAGIDGFSGGCAVRWWARAGGTPGLVYGKAIVATIAVELHESKSLGRTRLAIVPDASRIQIDLRLRQST